MGVITNGVNYVTRQMLGDWADEAACKGMDATVFFPEKGGPGSNHSEAARRVCEGCTVSVECLEYALSNGERFGVWGGMSTRQRQTSRRKK